MFHLLVLVLLKLKTLTFFGAEQGRQILHKLVAVVIYCQRSKCMDYVFHNELLSKELRTGYVNGAKFIQKALTLKSPSPFQPGSSFRQQHLKCNFFIHILSFSEDCISSKLLFSSVSSQSWNLHLLSCPAHADSLRRIYQASSSWELRKVVTASSCSKTVFWYKN